ncbi:MAG: prepilin-type N-terminal cleavage/methylation domain-containing protein [Actinomycetota bacterium]|nr:prepilin-type N-terminal cleavage/methylation domain-containing protein [Actinomycetota bacterium]
MSPREAHGFSIVELLVGMALFSVVAAGFMAVLFSVARATDSTTSSVRISEEARLGLNRLVRDTREAAWIQLSSSDPAATHNSFTVKIDYNGDGAFTNPAAGTATGNYEIVTFAYDDPTDRITVTAAGLGTETLVRGVDCVRDAGGPCKSDVFSFTSNRLEYDGALDGTYDGVTTLREINAVACSPTNLTTLDICNGVLVDKELATVTSVNVAVAVKSGARSSNYFAEAQLRNRR